MPESSSYRPSDIGIGLFSASIKAGTAAGSWIHLRTPVRSMLFAGHTRRTSLEYYGGVVSFQRTDNAFSNVRAVKFLDMVAYAARQLS